MKEVWQSAERSIIHKVNIFAQYNDDIVIKNGAGVPMSFSPCSISIEWAWREGDDPDGIKPFWVLRCRRRLKNRELSEAVGKLYPHQLERHLKGPPDWLADIVERSRPKEFK